MCLRYLSFPENSYFCDCIGPMIRSLSSCIRDQLLRQLWLIVSGSFYCHACDK